MQKLIVRIVSIRGSWCVHKIGDFFEVKGDVIRVPSGEGVCLWALSALLPFLSASQRDSPESSEWVPTDIHCPDPVCEAVWKIEKVSSKSQSNKNVEL